MMQAQQTYDDQISFIRNNGQSPSEYLISRFNKHDLVLLGEDHAIKENLEFVKQLIPQLYNAGITNLCMEFGSYEIQEMMDSLLIAPDYNEQLARDMMFYYNVGWAYNEYTDIYKEVWKLNRSLAPEQKKFRIINLSYQYNWSEFASPRTPENMSKVFYLGTPDDFRTRIIEKEVIGKAEKALVYMGLVHVFTAYERPILKMNNDDFCDFDAGYTGNRLYRKYPGKVFNIMLHHPLEAKNKPDSYWRSPANGAIELIMEKNGNRPVGFGLVNTPMGELKDDSYFSMCHPDFRMKDFFDGYIFIKPFKYLSGCTVDPLFFANRSWKEIKRQMPDPDWHTAGNLEEYLKQLEAYVQIRSRYSEVIEQSIPAVSSGVVDRYPNFQSAYALPRNVDVWLPDNYSPAKKYSVVYMHDGQALYDKSTTWNNQAWDVDSIITSLIDNRKIKDCIVVGIWNTGKYRAADYFPAKPFNTLPESTKDRLLEGMLQGKAQSDDYLRFVVTELKPFIDSKYSTKTDKENTIIAGSSMGGLISMYAICEYPNVFGGAACLSTHWIGDSMNPDDSVIPDSFVAYLEQYLPSPKDHKIYFDYGTVALDSYYKPHQLKADEVLARKGYSSKNWITKEFPGKDHSENSWRERFDIPLMFMLSLKKK